MIFHLRARKQAAVDQAIRVQDAIVYTYAGKMLDALKRAVEPALEAAVAGGKVPELSLNAVDRVAEEFLIATVRQAFVSARHQFTADLPIKRLGKIKPDLPPDAHSLAALFRNRKAWDVMLKKNRRYAQGIKRAYFKKLRAHFQEIMPKLTSGEITIMEAKQSLEKAVEATGARVNTIFRNETTSYFAEAQINYFDGEPGILGFLFDSVRDSGRTDICRSRHGMVLKPGTKELLKNRPACHHGCRSHLIPLADTPENRKLVQDPSRQPANRTLVPLPRGWRTAA